MFKNPKNRFVGNTIKYTDRSIFIKKLKRQKTDEYSPIVKTNNSHKNLIKKQISNLSSAQSRFIKTTRFNDEFHSIFEKFKKDYNSSWIIAYINNKIYIMWNYVYLFLYI